MTIKELEELLGITRANIRYYEQELLIKPNRMPNGYRNYSSQDVQQLKKIKLMRELGVSIADLKKLQSNELSLTEEMEHQIQALTAQQAKLQKEQQICIAIQQDHVSYEQLDADKYLYHPIAPDTACEIDPVKDSSYQAQDRLPQISPMRRYLARMFDMILFTDIAASIISLFHINFNDIWSLPGTNIVIQLIWLFVEPLCIHFTGTTAGKWIFGLYLTDLDGRRPSYYDAFYRNIRVFFFGMGLGIPFVNLYRYYKSFRTTSDGWKLPWEDDLRYVQKTSVLDQRVHTSLQDGKWRYLLLAASFILNIAVTYGCTLYAQVPIHRGAVTLEEFSENYNQIARYLGYTEYNYRMKPDGTLYSAKELQELQEDSAGITIFSNDDSYRPLEFDYTYNGTTLKQVSLHIDLQDYPTDTLISYPTAQMTIAALAFAGAQSDIGFWSTERSRVANNLLTTDFSMIPCFSDRIGNMDITCDISTDGFSFLYHGVTATSNKNRFLLEFTVGSRS